MAPPALSLTSAPSLKTVPSLAPTPSAPPPAAAVALGPAEPLRLACRYFDLGCAGYVDGEDLEEILYMVSDQISSA